MATVDGLDVFVPNSDLVNSPVTNFTLQKKALFGVQCAIILESEEDIEIVEQLMLEQAAENPYVTKDAPYGPNVIVEKNKLLLLCNVRDGDRVASVKENLSAAIKKALDDKNIPMSMP